MGSNLEHRSPQTSRLYLKRYIEFLALGVVRHRVIYIQHNRIWVRFTGKHCTPLSVKCVVPPFLLAELKALAATLCILRITSHMGQITQERWDRGEGWQRGRPLAIVPSEIKVLSDDLSSSIMPDDNSKVFCPRIAPIVPESWTWTRLASWVRPVHKRLCIVC